MVWSLEQLARSVPSSDTRTIRTQSLHKKRFLVSIKIFFYHCFLAVLRIWDVYPRSQIRIFASRILGQKDSGSQILETVSKLSSRINDLECSLQIPDSDFFPSRIQGSKKHRIRNTAFRPSRENRRRFLISYRTGKPR
jgi:hypothetical protein